MLSFIDPNALGELLRYILVGGIALVGILGFVILKIYKKFRK